MSCLARRASTLAVAACVACMTAGWASAGWPLTSDPGVRPIQQVLGFTRGPALEPVAVATAFLDRLAVDSPETRVRLPVSIALDEHRLAIVDAHLGQPESATALRLQLNDDALGIALADRARDLCAAGRRCVLRLVGYWRGSADGVGRLDVRRVDGIASETAAAVIEIEAR